MSTVTDNEYKTLLNIVKGMVYGRFGSYDLDIVKDAVMDTWGSARDSQLTEQALLRYWARSATNRYTNIIRNRATRQRILTEKYTPQHTGDDNLASDTVYRSLELRECIAELVHADDRKYAAYVLTLVTHHTGEDLRKVAEAWFRDNISPSPRKLRDATKRIRDWVLALG
jgi:DNA-directed RNA polymerase specialized sigma24 family protein